MLSQLTSKDSKLFQHLHQVGWELYEREAYREAASIYRFLLLEEGQDATSWFLLGRCHQELGEETTARELFEIASRTTRAPHLFAKLAKALREEELERD